MRRIQLSNTSQPSADQPKYKDYRYVPLLKRGGAVGDAFASALIDAFGREPEPYNQEELVKIMAEIGHPRALDFIRENGMMKLRHMKMIDAAAHHSHFASLADC